MTRCMLDSPRALAADTTWTRPGGGRCAAPLLRPGGRIGDTYAIAHFGSTGGIDVARASQCAAAHYAGRNGAGHAMLRRCNRTRRVDSRRNLVARVIIPQRKDTTR